MNKQLNHCLWAKTYMLVLFNQLEFILRTGTKVLKRAFLSCPAVPVFKEYNLLRCAKSNVLFLNGVHSSSENVREFSTRTCIQLVYFRILGVTTLMQNTVHSFIHFLFLRFQVNMTKQKGQIHSATHP